VALTTVAPAQCGGTSRRDLLLRLCRCAQQSVVAAPVPAVPACWRAPAGTPACPVHRHTAAPHPSRWHAALTGSHPLPPGRCSCARASAATLGRSRAPPARPLLARRQPLPAPPRPPLVVAARVAPAAALHCYSRFLGGAGGVDVAQVLGREIEAASTQTSAALQRTQVRAWRARQPSPASGIRHHTTPRRIVPSLSPLARTAPPQLPWMLDRLRPSGVAVATLAWWHGLHRVNRVNRSTTYTPPGGAHSNLRY